MAITALKPNQVAELVNLATTQTLGSDTTLLKEDLSNAIEIGTNILNANAYVSWLNNLMIATEKKIFSYRPYKSKAPSILKSNFEYGLLTQKIKQKLSQATTSDAFNLVDNTSYDDNVFHKTDVIVKIFKEQDTFSVIKSITEDQLKPCFNSGQQLGEFVSQTFGMIENSLELFIQNMTKACINNMIGETIVANTGNDANVRVIKLLSLFKQNVDPSSTLTSANCIYNKDFLRYASSKIKQYSKLMEEYNTIYNIEHLETFTPKDMQHMVLLDEFASNLATYLESDTFHNEFVKLPYAETIAYFQAVGANTLADKSSIKIKTASGNDVTQSYICGVIFDHEALGMRQDKPKTSAHENHTGSFINYFYRQLFAYFNDLSESMVVFTLE